MSETYVGQISPEYTITYQDKKISFERPTFATEKSYTRFLEGRDRDGVLRHQRDLPPLVFKEMMNEWRHDVATGQYHWLSPLSIQSLESLECVEELLFYLMQQKEEQRKTISRELFHNICYSKSHEPLITPEGQKIDHFVISELRGALNQLINSPNFIPENSTP